MNETEERTGLDPRSMTPAVNGIDEEEPPGKPRRHSLWRDVPDRHWNDWRWQSQNAIRSVRQLRDLLPFTPEELEAIGSLEAEYKLAIPPYYFSLINTDDPHDPIRLQSVTSPLEMNNPSGYELEDPLDEDKDMPVPGLTHRYPDRDLLITTHVCTMYCRFCTRKRRPWCVAAGTPLVGTTNGPSNTSANTRRSAMSLFRAATRSRCRCLN